MHSTRHFLHHQHRSNVVEDFPVEGVQLLLQFLDESSIRLGQRLVKMSENNSQLSTCQQSRVSSVVKPSRRRQLHLQERGASYLPPIPG